MTHLNSPEEHILGQAQAGCDFAFDRSPFSQVIGDVTAGSIDVEVDFLVVVSADKECPANGKSAQLDSSRADGSLLESSVFDLSRGDILETPSSGICSPG